MDTLRPVELPDDARQRLILLAGWVGLGWCAFYGWFAVVRGGDVPVLWLAQLAVHETGHVAFGPAGEPWSILMGSGSEILVPLALAIGCVAWPARRNLVAAGMCAAVAAGALVHTATYIADAPEGELLLIGGSESDWLVLLDRWDVLYKAHVYAGWVRSAAAIVWLAAVSLVVAGMVLARRRLAPPPARASARPRHPVVATPPEDMWD